MVTHRLAESSISSSYVCVSKRPFIHVAGHSNPPYSVILLEVTWAIRITLSFHTQKVESRVTPKGPRLHLSPTSSYRCSKMHLGEELSTKTSKKWKLRVINLITWCRQSLTFQIILEPTGTKPNESLGGNSMIISNQQLIVRLILPWITD